MAWLRLIRWSNLLIIFLTQAAVWLFIIVPITGLVGGPNLNLGWQEFLLLTISTVSIAAAGYIINDYFDVRIDAINQPGKVILSKEVYRRIAIVLHFILNAVGLLLAIILACKAKTMWLIAFQVFCITLLWIYSTRLKQKFVWGNIVVSVMTTLTVLIVGAYEPLMSWDFVSTKQFVTGYFGQTEVNPMFKIIVFAFFAGMLTWMREIVKDMEDLKGDLQEGCSTMPIQWGIKRTVVFVRLLGSIVCSALAITSSMLLQHKFYYTAGFLLFGILTPLVFWMTTLGLKHDTRHYHRASTYLKLLMIAGIVALLILSFETNSKWTYTPV